MAAEARILSGIASRPGDPQITAICHGPGATAAAAAARNLAEAGVSGLISFGIAGGLKPGLVPGMVVIARQVLDGNGGRFDTDPAWRKSLNRRLVGDDMVIEGNLIGLDQPLLSRIEKARSYRQWGGIAVDTESHAIAAIAREAGIAFMALRAVADTAGQSLPRYITDGISSGGHARVTPILRGLAGNPLTLPALIAAGHGSRKALGGLRRVLATTGRGLGLVDFGQES